MDLSAKNCSKSRSCWYFTAAVYLFKDSFSKIKSVDGRDSNRVVNDISQFFSPIPHLVPGLPFRPERPFKTSATSPTSSTSLINSPSSVSILVMFL